MLTIDRYDYYTSNVRNLLEASTFVYDGSLSKLKKDYLKHMILTTNDISTIVLCKKDKTLLYVYVNVK